MRTLKGWIPTTLFAAVLMVSATAANAGVITGGLAEDPSDPCTIDQKTSEKYNSGVITGGLTGVITGGFVGVITGGLTGIIVTDLKSDDDPVNCGVITGG
jgi:hypothetical protein